MIAAWLALAVAGPRVELAAVGDLMLGRYVGRRIEREDADRIFKSVRPELQGADLAFGNLECVLSRQPFQTKNRIRLRGVEGSADLLARAGFDVLSVANNHALDAGEAGLRDTVLALKRAGIEPIGARKGPLIRQQNGLRIAFFAFCDLSEPRGGRFFPPGLESDLARDIGQARAAADVVVVSFHWGIEGTSQVTPRQESLAMAAARSGADLILGHHPHVLQPIRWISQPGGRRCLVAYSLGNFVFDAVKEAERRTLILKVSLGQTGVEGYEMSHWRIERGAPVSSPLSRSKSPESRLAR